MNMLHKAMTIAGSDASGGAGMEADLKTFQELDVYGMTALTVIVAQNPHKDWDHEISPIGLDVVEKQIETIVAGIGIDAMKTGMLGSAELVELVARTIDRFKLGGRVVDVLRAPEAAATIKTVLMQRADVVTPNTIEAAYLADMEKVETLDEIKEAAGRIKELGAGYVVIKSGSRNDSREAVDVLYDGREFTIASAPKIEPCYNHGAGCTYSAAITAGLANGLSVREAVELAKKFVAAALRGSFKLNEYSGATNHCAYRLENNK